MYLYFFYKVDKYKHIYGIILLYHSKEKKMVEITTEILNNFKTALESGENIQSFIQDNNLQGKISPQMLRQSFIDEYGIEVFRNHMANNMSINLQRRIENMAPRLNSIEKCDDLISALNAGIDAVNVRKAELES